MKGTAQINNDKENGDSQQNKSVQNLKFSERYC